MDRFGIYRTARWRKLRKAKIEADPVCQYCNAALAVDVDHRVPIGKGGDPWLWENLVSSCHSCHSRKTRLIDTGRATRLAPKGCDANGMPLDPEHWWRK